MIGTNDQRIYLTDPNKLQVFQKADEAIMAWLAIPSTNKVLGTSSGVSYTGTWSTDVYGIGKDTNTSGATATFSVYGNNVLIGMVQQNGQAGTFTVSIDGVSQGSFNSGPPNGTTVTTNNGSTYGPELFVFPNVGDGPHTVVITTTNNGYNYFDWAAGTGGTTSYDGPTVYVGNIPRYSAAGYATYGGSDANIATFNRVVQNNVSQLASMGLNVVLADVSSMVNPTTDLSSDGLHPNDAGHAHIEAAFLAATNPLEYARDRQNAQTPIPGIKWDLSNIAFWTQNGATWAERARFTANGCFGIGTTTPYSRLEVWGPDTASTSAFAVVNSASTTEFTVYDTGNAVLAGSLTQNSDIRLKTNIADLDGSSSLTEINALNPVTFNWIDPNKSSVPQFGFIAQQVQQIFPNLISTTSPTALTPDGTLSLNYIDLISPIVAAVQELDKVMTSLASTVAGFAQSFTLRC